MSTRRRVRTVALAVSALLVPLTASAQAEPYTIGSPLWDAALGAGAAHWGGLPCGGNVEYGWADLPDGVVGYASWVHPSQSTDPALFTRCRIDLDPGARLAPAIFCTVLAHELGHLHGHDHSADPGDLMAPTVREPIPECVTAMRAFAAAPAAAVEKTRARTAAGRSARTSRHLTGRLELVRRGRHATSRHHRVRHSPKRSAHRR